MGNRSNAFLSDEFIHNAKIQMLWMVQMRVLIFILKREKKKHTIFGRIRSEMIYLVEF